MAAVWRGLTVFWLCHFADRTSKSFLVPITEIEENDWDLSINKYKEIVYDEIDYASPLDIIKDIEMLEKERKEALTVLKNMLLN